MSRDIRYLFESAIHTVKFPGRSPAAGTQRTVCPLSNMFGT